MIRIRSKNQIINGLIFLVLATFIYLVFLSSISSSISRTNNRIFFVFHSILPQGWSFFTKSPREELLDIYTIEDEVLVQKTFSNFSKQNLFGLSKKSRRVAYEASLISKKLKESDFTLVKLDTFNLKNLKEVKLSIDLKYFDKGRYLLKKYEIIPISWKKNFKAKAERAKISKVIIE